MLAGKDGWRVEERVREREEGEGRREDRVIE